MRTETFWTRTEQVKVAVMPRDGDSMFVATAHQLSPSVKNLQQRGLKLRLGVSHYQLQNLAKYRSLMLNTISLHGGRYEAVPTEESKVLLFLQDLPRPGFPAGVESLQALADMLQVDIFVFFEGGDKKRVMSAADYINKTIGLGCRPIDDEVAKCHYDSVLSVVRSTSRGQDDMRGDVSFVEITNGSPHPFVPYTVEDASS